MVRVYTARHVTELAVVREYLGARGIATEVRNEFKSAALGQLPWTSTWPELWVVDERDAPLATRLISEASRADATEPAWRCASCGEEVDAVLARCWNCESARPE